jgi:S1-C subfamily serine protease
MIGMNENEAADADGVEIFRPSTPDAGAPQTTENTDQGDDLAAPPAPSLDAPRRRPRVKQMVGFGLAAVVLLGVGAGGGALAVERLQATQPATTSLGANGFGQGSSSSSGSSGSSGSNDWNPSDGTFGGFGSQGDSTSEGTSGSGTTATAAQQSGVVTIVSSLGYQSGEAAGTGIVLTSDGEILTNNHVIDGSTSIRVTVESTGRTYTASVVGTDPGDDVAVLKLKNASGLTTAKLASTAAAVGDRVTAVGNAGGTGTLSAASGQVTDLQQQIRTEAEGSSPSESLSGLIQTNANVVAGDSGGPLEDSSGAVVGMDTAASSGDSDVTAFAIPISSALRIAGEITSGSTSNGITIGYPAFLGVSVSPDATAAGAGVAQALNGTPAESAGIEAGDVITAVNGKTVGSASALTTVLHSYSPGDKVTIDYTDTSGASRSTSVTLTTGPAD